MKRKRYLVIWILSVFSCDLQEQLEEAIIEVSGKVTDDGEAVKGALVLLVESKDVSEGLSLVNGSVTGSKGRYLILDVDPGKYYVLAVDDTNGNMEFDADTDRLGFYGVDPDANDFEPNRITVQDEDVENINIVDLYSLQFTS